MALFCRAFRNLPSFERPGSLSPLFFENRILHNMFFLLLLREGLVLPSSASKDNDIQEMI